MDRLAIARHESGHAVCAHLEGFRVDSLELDPDGGQMFCVGPGDFLEAGLHPLDVGVKCALVAVAGAAVSEVPMSAQDHADLERAFWLADFDRRLFYTDRQTFLQIAREQLAEHADKVDRVARALVERGRLSGDEFRELLHEAG